MGAVSKARQAAHKSLVSCLANGKYVNLEVTASLGRSSLGAEDRALFSAIVYGVTERLITIDYIISRLSQRKLSEIDAETLCAIRIGICQIAFMDKIPPHAAVDESVELAPKKARGFVNALLRSYLRRPVTLPGRGEDEAYYLSISYSCPRELCSMLLRDYGREAEAILAAFFEKRKTGLHINTLREDSARSAERLGAVQSVLAEDVYLAPSFEGVAEGIEKGLWYVQDEASALCAQVLGAQPGETVIDVCAAPGGKSFAAAMQMKNTGRLYSFDLHENKLSLIRKGAEKLGICIINAYRQDARLLREELVGKADRVLCDAPCSGFGVIGKKPDIKYKSVESISQLPRIQGEILRGAAGYVKSGGTLVYSTCTLNKEENEQVAEAFLSENSDFSLCPFTIGGRECGGMLTLLPHRDKTDGFFICKLRKK